MEGTATPSGGDSGPRPFPEPGLPALGPRAQAQTLSHVLSLLWWRQTQGGAGAEQAVAIHTQVLASRTQVFIFCSNQSVNTRPHLG